MPRITEIFAFIAEDTGPEDEGVTAMSIGPLMLPMVGADEARVRSLMPKAQEIARITGKTIRLMRFSGRQVLKTINPDGTETTS
jgi:hypothetical protein